MKDIHNVRSKTDPSHVTKGCQNWAVAQCTIYESNENLQKNLPVTSGSVQFVIFNMLPDLPHNVQASKPCQ